MTIRRKGGAPRFAAADVVNGRIGSARVRSDAMHSAAAVVDAVLTASERDATRCPVTMDEASPLQRMQALGRLGTGRMNKTEAAYEQQLAFERHEGSILWYRFEALKLRLADNTFLTIDFPVITAAGELEFREVKGRWTDDARAKIKVAAAQFPFRFLAVYRERPDGWRIENLTSKSW